MENFMTLQNDLRTGDDLGEINEQIIPGYGQWHCCVDKSTIYGESIFHVLEVHQNAAWVSLREVESIVDDIVSGKKEPMENHRNKAVFRVSQYSKYNGIKLGQCVMLNMDQMIQLRDLLDEMIAEAGVVESRLRSGRLDQANEADFEPGEGSPSSEYGW